MLLHFFLPARVVDTLQTHTRLLSRAVTLPLPASDRSDVKTDMDHMVVMVAAAVMVVAAAVACARSHVRPLVPGRLSLNQWPWRSL